MVNSRIEGGARQAADELILLLQMVAINRLILPRLHRYPV